MIGKEGKGEKGSVVLQDGLNRCRVTLGEMRGGRRGRSESIPIIDRRPQTRRAAERFSQEEKNEAPFRRADVTGGAGT